jgi:hypothetical protein
MAGRLVGGDKKRWFELRCNGETDEQLSYALYYFKKQGDTTPKGFVRLSGFDTLALDEDDYRTIILEVEMDTETSHKSFQLIAEDGGLTQMWIDAFQNAIGSLNRLTIIQEDDEDDPRHKSSRQPSSRKFANWAKDGTSVASRISFSSNSNDNNDERSSSGANDMTGGGGGGDSPKPPSTKEHSAFRKRDIFKNAVGLGTSLKEEPVYIDWAYCTGNGGTSTNGKALLFAMMHEYRPSSTDEVRPSTSSVSWAKDDALAAVAIAEEVELNRLKELKLRSSTTEDGEEESDVYSVEDEKMGKVVLMSRGIRTPTLIDSGGSVAVMRRASLVGED